MSKKYFPNLKEINYQRLGNDYQKIIPIRKPDSCKSNLGLERKFRDKF